MAHQSSPLRNDMNSEELAAKVRAYYAPRLAANDDCYEAVGYQIPELVTTRYAILCEVGNLTDATVLEVGCGSGNLLAYLKERGFNGTFTGIDLLPEMIEQARQRHPESQFLLGEFPTVGNDVGADYVLASGVYQHASKELFLRSIEVMYERCAVAAAFNMFSEWCPEDRRNEYLFVDPLEIAAFCRRLTPNLILRHEYMPHDFTIYMYR